MKNFSSKKQRGCSFQEEEENVVRIEQTSHFYQTNFPCLILRIKSGGHHKSDMNFRVSVTIPISWHLISIIEVTKNNTGKYLDEIKASDITQATEEITTEDGY